MAASSYTSATTNTTTNSSSLALQHYNQGLIQNRDVNNSIIPHSSLNKRHNALAYHRVREMISAKVLGYYWIDGKKNPADIVSKHWSYPQVWHLLKPMLFYSGDTQDLIDDGDKINQD